MDLSAFTLSKGSHYSFDDGACAMELAAHLAGEPHSDHPPCVCPVLGAFVRSWNDNLPDDKRNELLKPIIPRLLNTRGSKKLETRRALMAADWLVRTHAPAWLRLAGLTAQADVLSSLPKITLTAQVPSIRGPIKAARKDAAAMNAAAMNAAAMNAVRAAAWYAAAWDAAAMNAAAMNAAAMNAAMNAVRAASMAAWDADRIDVRDVAGDAARIAAMNAYMDAAARDAAWDAAKAKLAPTVVELQASALVLIDRMISEKE